MLTDRACCPDLAAAAAVPLPVLTTQPMLLALWREEVTRERHGQRAHRHRMHSLQFLTWVFPFLERVAGNRLAFCG